MPREATTVPLYVRLGARETAQLETAVAATGHSKRQLVEEAVRETFGAPADRLVVGRATVTEPPPDILTTEEAAALLRVTPEVLIAAADAGDVPARKLGSDWRFARAAILAWLGER